MFFLLLVAFFEFQLLELELFLTDLEFPQLDPVVGQRGAHRHFCLEALCPKWSGFRVLFHAQITRSGKDADCCQDDSDPIFFLGVHQAG